MNTSETLARCPHAALAGDGEGTLCRTCGLVLSATTAPPDNDLNQPTDRPLPCPSNLPTPL